MRIFFIRHGDHKADKLTHVGKKQIKYASEYLKRENIVAIYSSDTKRCVDSAKIISKILKLPVKFCHDLREREKIENIVTPDDQTWYNNYLNKNYSHTNPEGGKEFFDRVNTILQDVISKHYAKNENVLLVGHSCNAYAIASYVYNNTNDFANWLALGNASIVCFEIK